MHFLQRPTQKFEALAGWSDTEKVMDLPLDISNCVSGLHTKRERYIDGISRARSRLNGNYHSVNTPLNSKQNLAILALALLALTFGLIFVLATTMRRTTARACHG
jgi:hypothetical protein